MITFLLSFAFAAAPECGNRISGYNVYETLEKGRVIEKYSVFQITEWSPESNFQGLLTVQTEKATTLEVENLNAGKVVGKISSSLSPWDRDAGYKAALDLDVFAFAKERSGQLLIRLKNGDSTVCESRLPIRSGH